MFIFALIEPLRPRTPQKPEKCRWSKLNAKLKLGGLNEKNEKKMKKKNEGRRVECLKPARQNEAGRVDAVSIYIFIVDAV